MALERTFQISRPLSNVENRQLRLYYNNLVVYHLAKINWTAFLAKAKKGSDEFGKKWKPLKPRTIAYKKRNNFYYSGMIAINIRTRLLLEAMRPGKFVNGKYVPTKGQIVEVTENSITFGVDIPYAEHVDSERRILVSSKAAIAKAKLQAEPEFVAYLKRKGLM